VTPLDPRILNRISRCLPQVNTKKADPRNSKVNRIGFKRLWREELRIVKDLRTSFFHPWSHKDLRFLKSLYHLLFVKITRNMAIQSTDICGIEWKLWQAISDQSEALLKTPPWRSLFYVGIYQHRNGAHTSRFYEALV